LDRAILKRIRADSAPPAGIFSAGTGSAYHSTSIPSISTKMWSSWSCLFVMVAVSWAVSPGSIGISAAERSTCINEDSLVLRRGREHYRRGVRVLSIGTSLRTHREDG